MTQISSAARKSLKGDAALSGASEALFAAVEYNSIQERFVHNPSVASPLAINIFGDPAVLNGQGCIQLPAGGSWAGRITNAINVIGTAGQPITAGERY